jgi:hypothetical protein
VSICVDHLHYCDFITFITASVSPLVLSSERWRILADRHLTARGNSSSSSPFMAFPPTTFAPFCLSPPLCLFSASLPVVHSRLPFLVSASPSFIVRHASAPREAEERTSLVPKQGGHFLPTSAYPRSIAQLLTPFIRPFLPKPEWSPTFVLAMGMSRGVVRPPRKFSGLCFGPNPRYGLIFSAMPWSAHEPVSLSPLATFRSRAIPRRSSMLRWRSCMLIWKCLMRTLSNCMLNWKRLMWT